MSFVAPPRTLLTEAELLTVLGMDASAEDPMEAILYGPYNTALTSEFNLVKKNIATLVVPQAVVAAHFDVDTLADEVDLLSVDGDDLDDEDIADPDSPSPTRPGGASRSLGVAVGTSDQDKPSQSQAEADDNNKGGSPPRFDPSVVKKILKLRSQRVPDFGRMRMVLNNEQKIIARRWDLLVEIKRGVAIKNLRTSYLNAQQQGRMQAAHAFAADPTINTIGLIAAVGEYWGYFELDRASAPHIPRSTGATIYNASPTPSDDSRFTPSPNLA
ncbi:hypothetical protein HGRIS_013967 [Hohenbuehelia grisea]|uniref:Uncharacterized protein n=1 Tax=Hohenbuehelia grisea TaxID=104357 RepID=A0ABR3JTX3_9AGAR